MLNSVSSYNLLLLIHQAVPTLSSQLTRAAATSSKAYVRKPSASTEGGKKRKGGQQDGNPRLQAVIEMLMKPDVTPGPSGASAKAEAAQLQEEIYAQHMEARRKAWERDMRTKHCLQIAALKALPPDLREKAMQPDNRPTIPARQFLFDTAPLAYGQPDASPKPAAPTAGSGSSSKTSSSRKGTEEGRAASAKQ